MRIYYKKDIIVKGKIIDHPILTLNMSMNASAGLVFPLLVEEIVHIPEGLDSLPFKVGDPLMVSAANRTYALINHEVEVKGLLFVIKHTLMELDNLFLKAKNVFNITHNFSFDY